MEEKDTTKKEKNAGNFVNALGNLYSKVSQVNRHEVDENQEFVQLVAKAHEEWQNAENFFHNVSQDPDLIDHAIYKLEACRARYIYLLKQARANGIKVDFLS